MAADRSLGSEIFQTSLIFKQHRHTYISRVCSAYRRHPTRRWKRGRIRPQNDKAYRAPHASTHTRARVFYIVEALPSTVFFHRNSPCAPRPSFLPHTLLLLWRAWGCAQTMHGSLARFVTHPSDFCFKLPEGMPLEEGAMCEPVAVGVHACRRAGVQAR